MINFTIDKERCTQCGLCAKECPVLIINGKTEFPEIKEGKEGQCIKCQHCLAVCPSAALSIWGKNPDESMKVTKEIPAPAELERLIKTRRSIRKFKDEELDRDLVHQLIDTAAYAPTGHNKNAVMFSVIDNKADLASFREAVYNGIKKAKEEDRLPEDKAFLYNIQQVWENKGIDIIFRNAPHVFITSTPKNVSSPEADCTIAMSYFELLANSNGVGTLWNGFIKWVLKDIAPELSAKIGIPEDHVVSVAMLFGKPAVKYARAIQNGDAHVNRISL